MSSYPSAISSPADLLIAKNNWTTRLFQAAGPADTDLVLEGAVGLQPTNGLVSIDDEIIQYGVVKLGGDFPVLSGCVRGYDGSVARPHEAHALVEDRWVAEHHNRLIQALLDLVGAVGDDPAYDPNSGVRSPSLASRLKDSLPLVIAQPSSASWLALHSRGRLVQVSLFRYRGTRLEPFTAPVQQTLSSGTATVTATLDQAESGYMVLI